MKFISRVIIGVSLLFAANTWAMDIQAAHSGSWYNASQSGHGFSLQVLNEEKMVVYWFVYTPDGEPTFLVSLADIDGDTANGTLYQYSGMQFGEFNPENLIETEWGTISIEFTGCDTATVTYQSTATRLGIPYGMGQIDLVRLASIDGLNCTPPLPEGKFGNFSTGLEYQPNAYWPTNSFVWILRDGTLAYQLKIPGVTEIGYGHLAMTGENTFEFEVTAVETTDVKRSRTRSGTGKFEDDRVKLDLGNLGVLNLPLDPAFHDEITYEELAGEYAGPDAMFIATIDETGEFTVVAFDIWGAMTIPEPGLNQIVQEWRFDDGGVDHGVGVYDRASGNLLFIKNRESWVFKDLWFRAR